MKPIRTLALVTPGAVSGTPFARFPGISRIVTHVVAPTYRQASRVANNMYFAKACEKFEDAKDASMFLVCDASRIANLMDLVPNWRGRAIFLAVPEPEAAAVQLRERGARVALLTVFDEITPCRFFVEGDVEASAAVRKVLHSVRGDVRITVDGARPYLEAARLLTGPILMALLEGTSLNLRQTGLPLETIRDLLGKLTLQTVRVHQRSGARTWRAPDFDKLQPLLARFNVGVLAEHLRASESAARNLLAPPD